jgi:hypothetical protein
MKEFKKEEFLGRRARTFGMQWHATLNLALGQREGIGGER